ncbi:MAG: GNAT family N-acetyltransferase [Dehalococcoidales bacterium]|nr:GNAT family N-acetyltransferase [Dehalococcoidales bacterium]
MSLDETDKRKPEVEIREMEIDDVPAVYHLGEALFTSEDFPILYRTWDPYEVTDYFTSDPEYCLVAECNDKIVGFILSNIIEKEGTAWKKYGYVAWIGVADDFQRTNLGHRLYNKMEDIFIEDGVRMVIADTDAENLQAIGFFSSLDFTTSAEHVWLTKTIQRKQEQQKREKKNAGRKTGKKLPGKF